MGLCRYSDGPPSNAEPLEKILIWTVAGELADDDSLGTAKRAREPARRQRNAAAIVVAERKERGGSSLVCSMPVRRCGRANGLQKREGEHLDLGRAARTGAVTMLSRPVAEIDKAGGDAHAGAIVADKA